ncbi:MAG: hypothetical protein KY445_07820 [Armatimonadetes bacterium]|nr:hypothetical protein [Armatimonadota bacterium]
MIFVTEFVKIPPNQEPPERETPGRKPTAFEARVFALAFSVSLLSFFFRWLAAVTRRMVAHGPFSFVPATFRGAMQSAWQKEIFKARQIAANTTQAMESLAL